MWYKSVVKKGNQLGQKINFPTVNLDPSVLYSSLKEGVYASLVKYKNKIYKGALYFGPHLNLNKQEKVLEIHMLDFNEEIYGEEVEFEIKDFVRPPLNFGSIEELKEQIKKDIKIIVKLLNC